MRNPTRSCFIGIIGRLAVAVLVACGPQLLAPSAMAQGHGGRSGGAHAQGGGGWHGGGGGWHGGGGGWHGGGGGWYGGGWYGGLGLGVWGWPYYWDWPYYGYEYYPPYYPPAYQAPTPYYPPAYQAPTTVIQQAPALAAEPPSWYYCADPKGYYPYVQSCKGPWRRVPVVPPAAAPGAQR